MKHGRRHTKLKEGVYVDRFRQRAEGCASEYRAIDVAEPTDPQPLPEPVSDVEMRLRGKAKKGVKRLMGDD